MKPPVKLQDKKVYEAPSFFKYETLREMTAANRLRGMKDSVSSTAKTG
jgi:hypothetical protein